MQAVTRELFGGLEHHGPVLETSCLLALDASRVQMDAATCAAPRSGPLVLGPRQWREFYPQGTAGIDPRRASAEAGQRSIATAVDDVCTHLKDW